MSLEELLKVRLDAMETYKIFDRSIQSKDVKSQYALKCCDVLSLLDEISLEEEVLLGVKDQKACSKLVSIITCWGIVPFMRNALGDILLKKYNMKLDVEFEDVSGKDMTEEELRNQYDIYDCCQTQLINLVCTTKRSVIGNLIFNSHFNELLITVMNHYFIPPQFQSKIDLDYLIDHMCTNDLLSGLLRTISDTKNIPELAKTEASKCLYKLIGKADGVDRLFEILILQHSDGPQSDIPLSISSLEQISMLLVSSPIGISLKDYYLSVCDQLLKILYSENSKNLKVKVASFSIVTLVNKRPKLAKKLLIEPLIIPLLYYNTTEYKFVTEKLDIDGNMIIASENDILNSVEGIQKLLVGNEPSHTLIDNLFPAFIPLYYLYQFSAQSVSNLTTSLLEILQTLSRLTEVENLLLQFHQLFENSLKPSSALIRLGPTGSIMVCLSNEVVRNIFDPQLFCSFLKGIEKTELIGELFVQIIEKHLLLKKQLTEGFEEETEVPNESAIKELEDLEILYASLILLMMDCFGDTILKNVSQVLRFVKVSLIDSNIEVINLGLSLLLHMLGTFDEERIELKNVDDELCLSDIKMIIATLVDHQDPDISNLSLTIKMRLLNTYSKENVRDSKSKSYQIFDEAIVELSDELLPVRAKGMGQLRSLVLMDDPVALEHLDTIITIFLDLLQDEDSFIYLNAIKGVSAIADIHPLKILIKMADRYSCSDFNLQSRLRMGESLLQVIRRLGNVFPKYANYICKPIMIVLRDPDVEMKSSAMILTSLIAKYSHLTLTPFIYQLFDFIIGTLQFEKEIQPRRAVLVLVSDIIRSFGTNLTAYVDVKPLKRLQILVRDIDAKDSDRISKGHAGMILEDLSHFMFL
ncbi:hypothetical protein BC833DRAFT_605760 [Globomyces pollinis-pini]|nr:hypothetical protein BC833DRAFT_605760 [Globomyces pollinis-pini]